MARIVIKTAKGPKVIAPQAQPVTICMCGLSKNQPFCDGSHMKTQDEAEGKVYEYSDDESRKEVCDCANGKNGDCACNCSCSK